MAEALKVLALLVRLAVGLIVGLIVIGAVLYVLDQDDPGSVGSDVIDLSDRFVFTRSVFELDDNDVQLPLNYGLSVLIWLAIAVLVGYALRRGAAALRSR
jgi:hypothetical protein